LSCWTWGEDRFLDREIPNLKNYWKMAAKSNPGLHQQKNLHRIAVEGFMPHAKEEYLA
jgi:hypothetical protein